MILYTIYAEDDLGITRQKLYHITREAARDPLLWRYVFGYLEESVRKVTANGGFIICRMERSP